MARAPAGRLGEEPEADSDANPDEALKKAVAHAMRHSPTQQGSAAYDKEGAERTWAAAVRVAGAFAARFA